MRALALAALLALGGPAGAAETVPEPEGYRMDTYRAPVPATLLGAPALTTEAAAALHAEGAAFVDVYPKPPKPAGLPEDTLWLDPRRDTIPGAVWLPNTGYGRTPPSAEGYLERGLAALTGGDKAKALVFFCLAECWMSWNAARRAIEELGYTAVSWYADGTDGWEEAGLPLETVSAWE